MRHFDLWEKSRNFPGKAKTFQPISQIIDAQRSNIQVNTKYGCAYFQKPLEKSKYIWTL
jgi:hypothetical protein